MELTIHADGAEAAGSLRGALDEAGEFELSEAGDAAVAVVTGPGGARTLVAALSKWLQSQPPGSGMTVETSTQVFTVHAGDPRAAIALTEAVTREARAAEERDREPHPKDPRNGPAGRDADADWQGPSGGTGTDFDTDL
jgi:hypothetical protein